MSDRSKIEWTDATWNPLRARDPQTAKTGHHCVKISPACAHCYAASMNKRFGTALNYAADSAAELFVDDAALVKPLAWKRPRRIFPCSMTDLFLDAYPEHAIDAIFAVMYSAQWHTFQVLTKRPERMKAHLNHPLRAAAIGSLAYFLAVKNDPRKAEVLTNSDVVTDVGARWPLPNIWLGVTAEDQQRADERREPLRQLANAGWTTFVSNEPALGPIDWTGWEFVKQIISGGEACPGSRPSHPAWIRATRDFCVPRGIAFFFKQWGDWIPADEVPAAYADTYSSKRRGSRNPSCVVDDTLLVRVGKKVAGRLIDGRTWNEFPQTEASTA